MATADTAAARARFALMFRNTTVAKPGDVVSVSVELVTRIGESLILMPGDLLLRNHHHRTPRKPEMDARNTFVPTPTPPNHE